MSIEGEAVRASERERGMVRVAIDYAGHWEFRSGVWRYGVSLTKALVQTGRCGSVRVPCFTRPSPAALRELTETCAEVGDRGLYRHLDRLEAMARRRGRFVPWNRFVPYCLDRGLRSTMLRQGLENCNVYHSLFFLREQLSGVRVAVTIHDVIPLVAPEIDTLGAEVYRQNLERCRRECDVVIVPSESTKQDLIEHGGIESSRIRVVYHGIDHECFHPGTEGDALVHSRYGLKPRGYLLYVGAIDRRKNLPTLVDAYLLARRSKGVSLPLVLAGPEVGGWDTSELTKRLQSEECRNCVRYLGYCSDAELPALYRGARALCFVSLYEGFGFPALEAMACGTPVVASKTSSLGEIVGEAAAKVDPRDVDEIADAIATLSQDDDAWGERRSAGFAHARQFTWENAANSTYLAYIGESDEELNRIGAAPDRNERCLDAVAIPKPQ